MGQLAAIPQSTHDQATVHTRASCPQEPGCGKHAEPAPGTVSRMRTNLIGWLLVPVFCLALSGDATAAGPADPVTGVSASAQARSIQPPPPPSAWSRSPFQPPLADDLLVTRRFEPPPVRWLPGHRGVDLASTPGAVVYAAGDGRVHFAGPVGGVGVVSITHPGHGGLRTTYQPVAPIVQTGDWVTAGDPLGVLGSDHAGCTVAACLHWGARRGEHYLDPLSLLGLGSVRLLPRTLAGAGAGDAPGLGGGKPGEPPDLGVAALAPVDIWWQHGVRGSDGP